MAGLDLPGIRNNPATKAPEKPTLEDVGKLAERPDVRTQLKDSLAAEEPKKPEAPLPTADDGVVRYSSHPIIKYKVGRFRFENGLLELRDEKDVEDFKKILDQLPLTERIRIKELDISAAEAQVRAVLAENPSASKAIGSESGNRDPGKQVGRGTLGE